MWFDFFSIVQFYAKLVFLNLKNEAVLRKAVLTSQGSSSAVHSVVNMAACILSFPALFPYVHCLPTLPPAADSLAFPIVTTISMQLNSDATPRSFSWMLHTDLEGSLSWKKCPCAHHLYIILRTLRGLDCSGDWKTAIATVFFPEPSRTVFYLILNCW